MKDVVHFYFSLFESLQDAHFGAYWGLPKGILRSYNSTEYSSGTVFLSDFQVICNFFPVGRLFAILVTQTPLSLKLVHFGFELDTLGS